jgi:hypothetical protein
MHKVELCFTPTVNASWANPIESQFGTLCTFTMNGSNYRDHIVLATTMQPYLGWRNKNARPTSSPPNAANEPASAANANADGERPAPPEASPQPPPEAPRTYAVNALASAR